MRNILLFTLIVISISYKANSQAPQQINYQAVARNASGNVLINQTISVRFTIHDIDTAGTIDYQEIHTNLTTNKFGLFITTIGTGTQVGNNTFPSINWGANAKYLQVELDPAGGSNFVNMGFSQLNSVPYALFAANVTPGPSGATGASGTTGLTGPTGIGIQGNTGQTGATGPTGVQGNMGQSGAQGVTGATGTAGLQGNTGSTGTQGLQGNTGATGNTGSTGQFIGMVPVVKGGSGDSSFIPYAPIFGGTTSTGPLQSGAVGTAGQILTSNGSGMLPTFQPASTGSVTITIPAGENITAGQAVYLGGYTSASVTYDNNYRNDTVVYSSSTVNISHPFVVTANAYGALILEISVMRGQNGTENPPTISNPSYGTSGMTLLGSITDANTTVTSKLYGLTNNSLSGSNNITFSVARDNSSSNANKVFWRVFSYLNVGTMTSTSVVGDTSITISAPSAGDVVLGFTDNGNVSASTILTSSNLTQYPQFDISSIDGIITGAAYSGATTQTTSPGNVTVSASYNFGNLAATSTFYAVCLQPSTPVSLGFARLASSANALAPSGYEKFIGIATTSAPAGSTLTIQTNGLVTGLSSMSAGSIYYLNDISGTIGTTVGTNIKRIGIAISASSLLLMNALF